VSPPATAASAASTTADALTSSGILLDDLKPDYAVQLIGPGDLVEITIPNLVGIGVQTTIRKRVADPAGTINLPLIGDIKVAGMTDAEAQRPIDKAYIDGQIISDCHVMVSRVEAPSSCFSVLCSFGRPGNYACGTITRLTNALADADAHLKGQKTVVVVRKVDGAKSRMLKISLAELMAGASPVNIFMHAGDVVILPAPDKMPATVPVQTPVAVDHGELYIGGNLVKRAGVYSIPPRGITLKQAIISSGGLDDDGYIRVLRRDAGKETLVFDNVQYSTLSSGSVNDIELHPGDTVMVNATSQPWLGATTQQAVTP
jgi:polysaccharide export outer membrane protein